MQNSSDKKKVVSEILTLSNFLDKYYLDKTKFRNHCYLRIAYDNATGSKWDKRVEKPFIKNADLSLLNLALSNLLTYKADFMALQTHNKKSLKFRFT